MKYSLIRLLKNIKYLMQNNLCDDLGDIEYRTLMDFEENYIYEFSDRLKCIVKPQILDYEETLAIVTSKKKSFCRLGDGEIDIMNGKDIPFQKYSPQLAEMLVNILHDDSTDMYVGINYSYFYNTDYMDSVCRKFYLTGTKNHRKFLLENCNLNRIYINATFNQSYMGADSIDHEQYYDALKKLFVGENIVLFVGEGVIEDLKYDLFEFAESKTVITGPSKDAFSEYSNILEKARTFPKDYIICFILGPASKALVYQLTKEGYMSWDIGHMAKDYNAYKEKMVKNTDTINSFYAPD